jgi:hypothetical protein
MSDVLSALKIVYSHDYGKDYDKVCMFVLQAYKRGGRKSVVSLLQAPEYKADPCAKLFRELLRVKTVSGQHMFKLCQARRSQPPPDWIKDHGWRINRWPEFLPYIPPKQD